MPRRQIVIEHFRPAENAPGPQNVWVCEAETVNSFIDHPCRVLGHARDEVIDIACDHQIVEPEIRYCVPVVDAALVGGLPVTFSVHREVNNSANGVVELFVDLFQFRLYVARPCRY